MKIQQLPLDKPKTKSSRNKNRKQKTVKFAGNQEQTRNDASRFNTVNNLNVLPIVIVVPFLEKRK